MVKIPREKPSKDPAKNVKVANVLKTDAETARAASWAGQAEAYEKVISVNRCSKVVKGGKRFSFAALVVIGNGKGEAGFAIGKANEVSDAIRKGTQHARKNTFRVPIKGTTIPHEVIGLYGAGRVIMKPAAPGTGIIAGGAVRALCQAVGIKDILAKSLGTNNAINVLRASVQGFQSLMQFSTIPSVHATAQESSEAAQKTAADISQKLTEEKTKSL
ncbi:MAG: 30S ribosomal protein S5 [Candidatus Omnitrophica bacterium]|nr:30S ribosomal protein S5 [Candidatus Omnitrophota bacterium]